MANPVIMPCPKDQWTRVARNVLSGVMRPMDKRPGVYLHTYRLPTSPAPVSTGDGLVMSAAERISSDPGIDIYVMPLGADGSVRADVYEADGGALAVQPTVSQPAVAAIALVQSGGTFILPALTATPTIESITLTEGE